MNFWGFQILWAFALFSPDAFSTCTEGQEVVPLMDGCQYTSGSAREYFPWRVGERGSMQRLPVCQGSWSVVSGAVDPGTGQVEIACDISARSFWINPRHLSCGDLNLETHPWVTPSGVQEGQIAMCVGGDRAISSQIAPPQSHSVPEALSRASSILLQNAQTLAQGCLREVSRELEAIERKYQAQPQTLDTWLERINILAPEGNWLTEFTRDYDENCDFELSSSLTPEEHRDLESNQSFCRIAKDSRKLMIALQRRLDELKASDETNVNPVEVLNEIGREPHDSWSEANWPWVMQGERLDPSNLVYLSTLKKNVLYYLLSSEQRRSTVSPDSQLMTRGRLFYGCYYFSRGSTIGETQTDCSMFVNRALTGNASLRYSVSDWVRIARGEFGAINHPWRRREPGSDSEDDSEDEKVGSCFERVIPRTQSDIQPGDIVASRAAQHIVVVGRNNGDGTITTFEAAGGNLNAVLTNAVRPIEEPGCNGNESARPIRSDLYVLRLKPTPPETCPLFQN